MDKICSKCNHIKTLNCFNNDKRYGDGKYPSCKDCKKITYLKYYALNKNKIISKRIDKHLQHLKNPAHRDKHNEKCRIWHSSNPRTEYQSNYAKKRRASDINFKISGNLRNRLVSAIKNNQKMGSAVKDLGCSIEELKLYLEVRFINGMSWDNWGKGSGKWNIDHIIPLVSFDLTNREELLKACHYTNLQPLWESDNIAKGGNIV
jgi:hypothetical protein